MPCYEPPATASQQKTQLTLELLAYVRDKLRLKLAVRHMKPGETEFHGDNRMLTKDDADYATKELCWIIRGLSRAQREDLVYDAHDRDSRRLADWWEEHEAFDKGEGR